MSTVQCPNCKKQVNASAAEDLAKKAATGAVLGVASVGTGTAAASAAVGAKALALLSGPAGWLGLAIVGAGVALTKAAATDNIKKTCPKCSHTW